MMAIGACFSFGGLPGDGSVEMEVGTLPDFLASFCSISLGFSLNDGFGLDNSTCVKGMCNTVQVLWSMPIASGGTIFE